MTNELKIPRALAETLVYLHETDQYLDIDIAKLRALLAADPAPSEAELIGAGFGYPMSKEGAVKAYKASLQPRTDHPSNADCEWCHGCGHDHYGEPCVGCCKPAAPVVERQEPVAWIKQKSMEGLTKNGMVYVTGFDLGNSIPLYTHKDERPEHLDSIRMLEAAIRVSKGWMDNASNPNKDHDKESIAEVCRSVSRLLRDTLSALSSRGDTPAPVAVVLPDLSELREYHAKAVGNLKSYADDAGLRDSDVKHYFKRAAFHSAMVALIDKVKELNQ